MFVYLFALLDPVRKRRLAGRYRSCGVDDGSFAKRAFCFIIGEFNAAVYAVRQSQYLSFPSTKTGIPALTRNVKNIFSIFDSRMVLVKLMYVEPP